MKIDLGNGDHVIVDPEDYPVLSRFNYQVGEDGTLTRAFNMNGKIISIPMYKFIIRDASGKVPIFKNKNNHDLRKENIELVSKSIFAYGSYGKRTFGNKTSKYRGVMRLKKISNGKEWKAQITKNRKRYHQYCRSEKEAAYWYNKKAIELFGEYAYQNKID